MVEGFPPKIETKNEENAAAALGGWLLSSSPASSNHGVSYFTSSPSKGLECGARATEEEKETAAGERRNYGVFWAGGAAKPIFIVG